MRKLTPYLRLNLSLLLCCAPAIVCAGSDQFAPHIRSMETFAAALEQHTAVEKLAGEFSDFFGTPQAAIDVFQGIAAGHPIALQHDVTIAPVNIPAVARPMSLANAYIAVSLVKMQLMKFGISRPTAAQIKMAMNGGVLALSPFASANAPRMRLPGVLKRRAAGQKWELIAKQVGVAPDILSYRMQAANYALIRPTNTSFQKLKPSPFFGEPDAIVSTVQTDVVAPKNVALPKQVAAQEQVVPPSARMRKYGAGIVTAGGGSPPSINSIYGDNSEGIVTASGGFIPSSATSLGRASAGGL